MRVLRFRALVWLLPAMVILLAGCASNHPMVSTWRNSTLLPTRSDKIALAFQNNSSPKTEELGRLLTAELRQEGFKLVPTDQADYLMAYTFEDDMADQGRPTTLITPGSAPQTAAQITGPVLTPPQIGAFASGPASAPVQTTFVSQPVVPTIPGTMVSQPVVYRNRGIRLFLYNNPQIHPGNMQIIWQGYIVAGGTPSAERETELIRTLLGYLGQEYHGTVNLGP